MTVRLVAVDLCGQDGDLTERDKAVLREAEGGGAEVALASARRLDDLVAARRRFALTGSVIAERGAMVADGTGAMLVDERIPPVIAREIVSLACELDAMVCMRVAGRIYVRPRKKRWWERTVEPDSDIEVVTDLAGHVGDGPTLIVANGPIRQLMQKIPHDAIKARLVLPGTDAESIVMTPIRGTYAHALRAIQHRLGVTKAETLAIVESEDAHALFEEAAVRVARYDADERVVLSAEWRSGVARDDVAAALERFVPRNAP